MTRIYGLTGGIASGKSEAGRRFAELGIPVIDADRIGHELLDSDPGIREAILSAFGEGVLTCGKICREKLGARVFGNDRALKQLNAIIHPAIKATIAERCRTLAEARHEAVIVDAALLAEDGKLDSWLDGLILVLCPDEARVTRLMTRRGMSEREARVRIGAQTPPETKVRLADWVIDNAGSIEDLRARVSEIAEVIRGKRD